MFVWGKARGFCRKLTTKEHVNIMATKPISIPSRQWRPQAGIDLASGHFPQGNHRPPEPAPPWGIATIFRRQTRLIGPIFTAIVIAQHTYKIPSKAKYTFASPQQIIAKITSIPSLSSSSIPQLPPSSLIHPSSSSSPATPPNNTTPSYKTQILARGEPSPQCFPTTPSNTQYPKIAITNVGAPQSK